MTNAGIDYGMGRQNIDNATGIRYGVISQNSIHPESLDFAGQEFDYGDPTCPKCGGDALEPDDPKLVAGLDANEPEWPSYHERRCSTDYACPVCKHTLDSEDCFPEEATGWKVDKDDLKLVPCLDNDIFVLKSDYYTFAQFCSPCVPGAGNLDTPLEDGVKTYALGHDWFDGDIAPYPVFRVEDGVQIVAERKDVACAACSGTGKRRLDHLAEIRACTVEQVLVELDSGAISLTDVDRKAGTFQCTYCHGVGSRKEVVETEQPAERAVPAGTEAKED